jgi:DNA repair exonuclease SbcCD nuclease subunit
VVHSSDIHVEHGYVPPAYWGDAMAGLRSVLAAARAAGADVTLLAGDTFDCHNLPADLLRRAAQLLAKAGMPVVILPGNHDPAIDGSVFHHGAIDRIANVHVLGVTHGDAVMFPELRLEIWGKPHRDYSDMVPLDSPRPRSSFWQIAMAHGHYQKLADRSMVLRPSWLISEAEIAATEVDYLALGHWNRAARVGDGRVEAHYSGSPDHTRAVNLVRLAAHGSVHVERLALALPAMADHEEAD